LQSKEWYPLKFVFGSGEAFRSRLSDIPWIDAFLPSKILVAGVDENGEVEAICGIRGVFNILTLYVREQWRGRGVGTQILEKAINMARKRRLGFVLLGVARDNLRAFSLYGKFGFRHVVYLKRTEVRIMMLPTDLAGEFAYMFLRDITRLLPNTFWTYVAQGVHYVTVSDREGN
jgi:GNAT superfamily N-acetyltransferase